MSAMQVAEAKEAGAAGVIGVIAHVLGKDTSQNMVRFAEAAGLACPVEVQNSVVPP